MTVEENYSERGRQAAASNIAEAFREYQVPRHELATALHVIDLLAASARDARPEVGSEFTVAGSTFNWTVSMQNAFESAYEAVRHIQAAS